MFSIYRYLHDRYAKFAVLDAETSTISLSRSLYLDILKQERRKALDSVIRTGPDIDTDDKAPNPLRTSFWRMRDIHNTTSYAFFVNPDWTKHQVKDNSMVFQQPILRDPSGHMSIKALMPCCVEILSVYGISGKVVELPIHTRTLNGERYYVLSSTRHRVIKA